MGMMKMGKKCSMKNGKIFVINDYACDACGCRWDGDDDDYDEDYDDDDED